MPIYAYRCEDCGHELDALQKISDAPLTECPECGAAALKKQITAAAFRLKGAGWYETDFKKDGKKNLHETGDQPAAEAGKAGEAKGDKTDKTDKGETGANKEAGTKVDAAPKSEPKPKPKPKAKETTGGS